MELNDHLADEFEAHREHLKAVAYRMLGSVTEADDAVQEAWLRLSRAEAEGIDNLGGWLTTVVGRVSLDMLRSRKARREDALEDARLPEPVVSREGDLGPEQEAMLAESVGLALLVVLETLSPPERLSFVLHDMFSVPFSEIAPIVGRSPEATRQLASRARRRVRGSVADPASNVKRQREVVDAFLVAAREGRFEDLVALLDPDVVLRVDQGRLPTRVMRGAEEIAEQVSTSARLAPFARPVLVNGAPGFVVVRKGHPIAVAAFSMVEGRIAEMDIIAGRERLRHVDAEDLGL